MGQPRREILRSFPGLYKTGDVVRLMLQWLVEESETCRLDLSLIVEDDVERILLAADTILLAAITVDFDLDEFSDLLIEG